MTDKEIIDGVLEREGGWTDHPADRGGPTNRGITLATLRDWRPGATVEDLKALSREEATRIYLALYVKIPGLDVVADDGLRALLVDCSVNHGPARAVKMLQEALGVKQDGIFGPNTLAALSAANPKAVRLLAAAARIRFYGRIIANDHSQAVFAAGWLNRATAFVDEVARSI